MADFTFRDFDSNQKYQKADGAGTSGDPHIPHTRVPALEKAEDAVHASGDVGVFALTVRKDTETSTALSDGDYAGLVTDASGRLRVALNNMEFAEDSPHASGALGFLPLAIRRDTPASSAGTAGDYATLNVDALGRLYVVMSGDLLEDSVHANADPGVMALTVRKDVAASTAGSDGDYAGLTTGADGRLHTSALLVNLEKAEDAAHASGDKGVMALTVRKDVPASTATADGDYAALTTDVDGRLRTVQLESGTTLTLFTAEAGVSVVSPVLDVTGYTTLLVDVFMTATATVVPKISSNLGTGNGVIQALAYNVQTGERAAAITESGLYRVTVGGAYGFVLQITANTGSVTAAARAVTGGEVTPDAIASLGDGKVVTLVNAAVTDTAIHLYSLIVDAAMSAIQVRRYRRFKISINNAQNQAAKVSIYTGHSATGLLLGYGEGGLLYYEDAPLEANKRLLFISAPNVGINASGYIKSIPALDDVHSNVLIAIQYAVAPTAGGTLKIDVEMH